MDKAIAVVKSADFFIAVGMSLEVRPAASLAGCVPWESNKFLRDSQPRGLADERFHVAQATAAEEIR
jgi:NAD-dependent SIR2 family protein deacetylase